MASNFSDELSEELLSENEIELYDILSSRRNSAQSSRRNSAQSFCGDHKVLFEDSGRHEHRRCNNLYEMRKISNDVKQQQEYKSTNTKLHNLRGDLETLTKVRQDDKARLSEEKAGIQREMEENAKQIQKKIGILLQKGNDDLDAKFKEFENGVDKDIKILGETLGQVDGAIKGLQEEDIKASSGMKVTQSAKKVITQVSEHARKETLQFQVEQGLTKVLSQEKIGSLSFESDRLPPKPRLFHEVCKYTATSNRKSNINGNHGKRSCHILDSCLLHDDTLILTDLPHNLLIHVDQQQTVKKICKVIGEPWGICRVSKEEVAVTLIGKKSVQFVSTKDGLVLKTSFNIGITCRGLDFKDGELFVCCGGGSKYMLSFREGPGHIRVYNLQGNILKTIQNQIFGRPRDIILNPENNQFYITDEVSGIIILNRAGENVSVLKEKSLIAARGISFDSRGQMFVGCLVTSQVFLFEETGKLIHIPISKPEGVGSVRSLCFLAENYELLVTGYSNEVNVFKLTRQ